MVSFSSFSHLDGCIVTSHSDFNLSFSRSEVEEFHVLIYQSFSTAKYLDCGDGYKKKHM